MDEKIIEITVAPDDVTKIRRHILLSSVLLIVFTLATIFSIFFLPAALLAAIHVGRLSSLLVIFQ